MNEKAIDICASCVHDEPNFCSVIGVIPHCCKDHWTCEPGRGAKLYRPKPAKELGEIGPVCPRDGGYCNDAYTRACVGCAGTKEDQT